MVIRSLVPGGSAEHHGGLLPGDQLVSVNQTQLDLLSLAEAVEVLKSAPPGAVRLGIRKPLVVRVRLLAQRSEKSEARCDLSSEPVLCRWRDRRGRTRCVCTTHTCLCQR